MNFKTTKIPVHTCPTCGALNDAASNGDGFAPEADDITLCSGCGEITMFNEDLTQRIPNDEEMATIKAYPDWRKIALTQAMIALENTRRLKEKSGEN